MWKRVLIITALVAIIVIFGVWAENEIKKIRIDDFSREIKEEVVVSPTQSEREKAIVSRVIDGDTIELSDKRKVRYIGINSLEIDDKRSEIKCLAEKAKEINQKLVEGKEIEMENDLSETDKYGRLLRYVWIENKMVNLELVEEGWAEISTYPPDVKYQEELLNAQKRAKINYLGMWGKECQ